jgi:hypothetical protein
LLAKIVNANAVSLVHSGAFAFFAGKPAPTVPDKPRGTAP